jgi:hypothetical protein
MILIFSSYVKSSTHGLVDSSSNRFIILTQLRNSYSFLNYDLSKVNIVNDAACSCGAPREDATKVVLDGCEVGE